MNQFFCATGISVLLGIALSNPLQLRGAAKPTITDQPQNQTVVVGSNAVFTVMASGQSPLAYQWSLNGSNLVNDTRISGATTATITITNVVAGDAGNYRVMVSNNHGIATSSNAALTVLLPAAIGTQPTDQSVVVGSPAEFTVLASGTPPLTYQWYSNGIAMANGGRISGSTSATLAISNTQINDAAAYQVIISNNFSSATSTVASLTILIPPQFAFQPSNQVVHVGNNAIFSARLTGTLPLNYQWYFNAIPLADNNHSSGASTTNLIINNVQAADVGNYSLVATNSAGSVTSAIVSLNVNLSLADNFNPGASSSVYALAETDGGRVLAGGQFTNLAGQSCLRIGRLLPDGTSDSSYVPSADNTVYALAVQSNRQVIAGGDFVNFSGQPTRRLGLMNSNGSADGGYNPWPNGTVRCLAVQPDGLLLVGGSFDYISFQTRYFLARLQPSSLLDTNFTPTLNGPVYSLALQPDGKILAGGTFSTVNGLTNRGIVRLNPDGSVDTEFIGSIGVGSYAVNAILVQPDGRILVGGSFGEADGQQSANLARLNPDGSRDISFQADTYGFSPAVNSFSLQADGKIFVGGNFSGIAGQPRPGIARLLPDGSLDPAFCPSENGASVYSQSLQADGKLVLGGYFNSMGEQLRSNLARLNPIEPAIQNLTFDSTSITWQRGGSATEVWRTTFDLSTNGVDWLWLGEGARVTGGWQLDGLSLPANGIVRARGFVCGGSWFVESFAGKPMIVSQSPNTTVPVPGSDINFSAISAGGTPLFYQWLKNGVPLSNAGNVFGSQTSSLVMTNVYGADAGEYQVVLSNAWGSVTGAVITLNVVDPVIWTQSGNQSINAGQVASFTVNAAGTGPLQYQWRLNGAPLPSATNATLTITNAQGVDAGAYTVVVSNQWNSLTGAVSTLTVNLALPDMFNPGSSGAASQLALQQDGKILISGQFGQPNFPRSLVRFNPDGSSDPSFNFTNLMGGLTISFPDVLALNTSGQILIAGGSRQSFSLWRLNNDGIQDPTFTNAIAGSVYGLVLSPDGDMFAGGAFSYLKPSILTNLAQVQANGSVDTGFPTGVNGTVFALSPQPDGKLLAGGSFTQANGQTVARLIRLVADGGLDNDFIASANNTVFCLLPQPDGKILVAGTFTTLNGTNINRLGRLNADGSLDVSFNPNVNNTVNSLALQADGKIVLGGAFTSVSGLPRNRLARLNPDGTPDLLFNPDVNGTITAVGLQADGALVVGGNFSQINGQYRTNLARLAPAQPAVQTLSYDGTAITWLRDGTAPEVCRTTFETSADGSSWIQLGAGERIPGGWQLNSVSLSSNAYVRARGFTQGGKNNAASWFVESSFGPAVAMSQPNSRTNFAGTTASFWVAGGGTPPLNYRWLKAGQPLFDGGNVSGAGTVSLVLSNVLGADAGGYSVIVSNASGCVTSSVAHLTVIEPIITSQPVAVYTNVGQSVQFSVTALGTAPLDYQWLKNGVIMGAPNSGTLSLPNATADDIASYSVIVSSSYGAVTSSPVALTLNLVLPDSLNIDLNDEVRSLATQPDGKIYIGGNFNQADGQWFYGFGRLNPDGTRDTNFPGHVSSSADTVAVQPDGSVLVGGWFTYVNDWPHSHTCRFFPDGSLDPGVNPTIQSSTLSPFVDSLVPQPDGKFLIGGWFTSIAGQNRNYIGRFNADGTLDNFNPVANSHVIALAVQPDGKVIAAGNFTTLGGQTRNRIGRLNSDGTLDTNFNPNANSTVNSVVLQPDGKILIGGSFTSIAGSSRTYLARLNADGSIDPTLNVSLVGGVSSIGLQADGSIIVAGVTSAAGQTRYGVARVSATGVLDTNWSPQVVGKVSGVSIQPDGKVLLCGSITSVCGQPRSRLARLEASGPATHRLVCDLTGVTWYRSGTSPEITGVQFQISPDGVNWATLGQGEKVSEGWRLNTSAISLNAYVRAYGFASGGRWNGSLSLVEEFSQVTVDSIPPRIISNDDSFGFHSNQFGFKVQALPGQTIVVDTTTNLVNWMPLQTNTVESAAQFLFMDMQSGQLPPRYYRARSVTNH